MAYLGYILFSGVLFISLVSAQEEFFDQIDCYTCEDKAMNTTCAEPGEKGLAEMEIIQCRTGACVKWFHYVNHEMILLRSCSERMKNVNIQLASVCRHEKFGNGKICMCPDHLCNAAQKIVSYTAIGLTLFTISYLL